jgi:hypothetical protein
MQIVLTQEGLDKLTVILPESLRREDRAIRQALLKSQPDLDFLVRGGFLYLELSFKPQGYFDTARKRKRIMDLRERSDDRENPSS